MERHDIYTSLNQILGKIIGDTKLDLNELTTTDEISGWSSLVQTQLVVEIEKHKDSITGPKSRDCIPTISMPTPEHCARTGMPFSEVPTEP